MDFRIQTNHQISGVRATALIIKDKKLLTVRQANHYVLIGGSIKVFERVEDALYREVFEETGATIISHQLAYIVENMFHHEGIDYHNIEWHFICEAIDVPTVMIEGSRSYPIVWVPLDNLQAFDIRPNFLKHYLPHFNGKIEHIIYEGV